MSLAIDSDGSVPGLGATGPIRTGQAGTLVGAWRAFLVRRVLGLAINLALLVLVTFLIVQLIPGDPATAIAGHDASLARVEQVRHELGLDQPFAGQLWTYVAGVFHGDFGTSFKYQVPAMEIVSTAAPFTLGITLVSVLILLFGGLAVGMFVGIVTRGGRHRWLSTSFNVIAGFVSSIPPYIQATALVGVFAVWLAVLPPAYSGAYGLTQSAILPILSLSLGSVASVARIVRRETAVLIEQDYMRTGRGWRLPRPTLYLKHLLPNLLTTALTLSGIILTALLGSALIVEAVFAWPGLGHVVVQAIAVDKDYPVIRAAVFVIGGISLIITLVIDIILGIIDPRTLGGGHG